MRGTPRTRQSGPRPKRREGEVGKTTHYSTVEWSKYPMGKGGGEIHDTSLGCSLGTGLANRAPKNARSLGSLAKSSYISEEVSWAWPRMGETPICHDSTY